MPRGYAFESTTSGVLGSVLSANLNSAGSDNAVAITAAKYIVRKIVVTNVSTSLAVSAATVGVFTGAGGTGTTVVTAATLTALSAATKYVDMALALTADVLSVATLYVRNVLAHGSAVTADVFIIGDVLA